MEADPRSNRDSAPLARPAPPGPGGALTPTSSVAPRPRRRRQGGLNPWYFVLIGGLPTLILAIMLVPVAGGWPPPGHSTVSTPTPVWLKDRVENAFPLQPGQVKPAPELGPGWYIVPVTVSNRSGDDMTNVNVRAFFYDGAGQLIGAGLADTATPLQGEPPTPHIFKNGETRQLEIQAQLSSGPAPKAGTPTPAPPTSYARVEVKVIAVLPMPTAGPATTPATTITTVIPGATQTP